MDEGHSTLCNAIDHASNKCNLVTFQPNKLLLILKEQFSQPHKNRTKKKRKFKKKFNALLDYQNISGNLRKMRIELVKQSVEYK